MAADEDLNVKGTGSALQPSAFEAGTLLLLGGDKIRATYDRVNSTDEEFVLDEDEPGSIFTEIDLSYFLPLAPEATKKRRRR